MTPSVGYFNHFQQKPSLHKICQTFGLFASLRVCVCVRLVCRMHNAQCAHVPNINNMYKMLLNYIYALSIGRHRTRSGKWE